MYMHAHLSSLVLEISSPSLMLCLIADDVRTSGLLDPSHRSKRIEQKNPTQTPAFTGHQVVYEGSTGGASKQIGSLHHVQLLLC